MTFKKRGLHMILQTLRTIFPNQIMLGAIFAQILKIFRYFAQISMDFARIFTKSKLLGVRLHPLHPRLLHH